MAVKRYTIVGKNAAGEDITFEDSIKMSMTEARYKQDYLAIEIASVNAVFPHYEKVLVVPPSKKEEEIAKFWAEWEKVELFETYTYRL